MPNQTFKHLHERATQFGDNPVDLFLAAGLDYNGQAQCAYTANGYGLATSVKIDPGKIIGLTAEVGISGGVNRAKEALIIAQRGPRRFLLEHVYVHNPRPLTFLSLVGVMWEGELGAEFNLGVGFSAGASAGFDGKDGWSAATEVSHTFKKEEEEEEPAFYLDHVGVAASFEAFAGFSASASYKFHHFYGEDFAPRFAPAQGGLGLLREQMGAVFASGTLDVNVKRLACKFINANSKYFGSANYGHVFHIGTAELISKLEAGLAGPLLNGPASSQGGALEKLRTEAENHIAMLQQFLENKESPGMAFLRLSSHSPKGEAGLKATFSAEAAATSLLHAGVGGEVKGPTVAVEGKWAFMRFQTYYRLREGLVMSTEDTKVSYQQLTAGLLSGSLGAEVGSQLAGRSKQVGAEKALGVKTLNRMTYLSSIVYWERPDMSKAKPGQLPLESRTVRALPGSGLRVGQSCLLRSLYTLLGAYDASDGEWFDAAQQKYAAHLAKSLGVGVPALMDFLLTPEVSGLISDMYRQDHISQVAFERRKRLPDVTAERHARNLGDGWREKAVLLEAAYAAPADFPLELRAERKKHWHLIGKDTFENIVGVKTDVRTALVKQVLLSPSARVANLRALRLRYRIQDMEDNDKERFGLGFKVLGQGLGVTLKTVERAGEEGVVDLATVWMKGGKAQKGAEGSAAAERYEGSVPPAVLFCQ